METKCMHCGSCTAAVIHGGVSTQDGRIELMRDVVEGWEGLIDICSTGVLHYDASCYDVSDTLREVKEDRVFLCYDEGVTLPEGGLLLQADFALEILRVCEAEGTYTAIETSLYTLQDTLRQLLPYLDHIYANLKILDSAVYKAYTGVENTQILDNIRYLLRTEELRNRAIIRTPLVPETTARNENTTAITQSLQQCYRGVHYGLLNYNLLAKAKHDYLDTEYCSDENPRLHTKGAIESFYQITKDQGTHNLITE